jgi:hypothetical protein
MIIDALRADLVRVGLCTAAFVGAVAGSATPATAQSLEQKIAQRGNGQVRMAFPARDGVCPGGRSYGGGITGGYYGGYYQGGMIVDSDGEEWDNGCKGETVLVAIAVKNGKPTSVRTYVGGKWKNSADTITDLGSVSGEQAARYLFALATDSLGDRYGALYPATLASGVTLWPDILRVIEDDNKSKPVRKSAISWLGRSGGDKASAVLEKIVLDETEDKQVREVAINALSYRNSESAINTLIKYVKNGKDAHLRSIALTSLSRNKDPRVTALVEELVSGK